MKKTNYKRQKVQTMNCQKGFGNVGGACLGTGSAEDCLTLVDRTVPSCGVANPQHSTIPRDVVLDVVGKNTSTTDAFGTRFLVPM